MSYVNIYVNKRDPVYADIIYGYKIAFIKKDNVR